MTFTIGFIGAGTIISSHVAALKGFPEFVLAAVCDCSAEQLRRRMPELKLDCTTFTDYHRLLQTPPDVVLISLPHGLHASAASDALRAGCHVLVEKPMAVSVAECRNMLAAAQRHEKCLVVSEPASFYPGAVLTGEKFRAGTLGRFFCGRITHQTFYFRQTRPAWFLDPALSGGGMFMNLGIHNLAAVRTCLPGLTPCAVQASVGTVPEYRIEACTSAFVRYHPGGCMYYEKIGYYPPTTCYNGGKHFVFEEGIVTWDTTHWRMMTRQGKEIEEKLPEPAHAFTPIYANLLRALRGEPYAPRAREYAQDIAIVQAAYLSARQGREVSLVTPDWDIGKES